MLREVDKIDRKIERNKEVGPSAGVLVAVKDNIVRWMTAGSRVLERYQPPFDAMALRKLRESGVLVRVLERYQPPFDAMAMRKLRESGGQGCSKKIVRECRICSEEDEEHEMEAPCACNGTLKKKVNLVFKRVSCEINFVRVSLDFKFDYFVSSSEPSAVIVFHSNGWQLHFNDPKKIPKLSVKGWIEMPIAMIGGAKFGAYTCLTGYM
ncbi:hypothetical protein RHSIM_Rhsim05G0097600 [Rhododendron simsii]|uniref:RING-CH-type domain-containing protein n=1 Tax=Rhododendron simsii TaxID=118357 RepID=A0A834GYU0_RHOSS|nr:hypothetical protein RHSIM_Rhsim05G0097600 [Rhododendron simsii]